MGQRYLARTGVGGAACGGDGSLSGDQVGRAPAVSCGQRLRLTNEARSLCRVVEVVGEAPHDCDEEAFDDAILDISSELAQAFFSVDDVGAQEGRVLYAAPITSGNALGACDHLDVPASALAGFIGGPCNVAGDCMFTDGRCDTAGFPGGHCTRACTSSCPDSVGANAFTACADPSDGSGLGARCHARCDFSLFPSGCRTGYACVTEPSPSGGADRDVCVPASCAM